MSAAPASHIHIGKAARLLLIDLGLRPDLVLRRAGLPTGAMDGEGSFITLAAYDRLWQVLSEMVDDPALPLKLGDTSAIDYFDPAFFAAMCSPDMNAAAARLAAYKARGGPFQLAVTQDARGTQIAFHCPAHPQINPTLALTEIVFLVNFIRRATRDRIAPLSVTMPFAVPAAALYTAHFGCAITPGPHPALTLSPDDAAQPFVTRDDAMWEFFAPRLRPQELTDDAATAGAQAVPIRDRVQHCLAELLPTGRASVAAVARELAMSKRTLQRRLATEGTTWQDVLNDARNALAKHYLTTTELGAAEVSFLLGFEDPNSLFRAFKRWENTSPEIWRAQQGTASSRLN